MRPAIADIASSFPIAWHRDAEPRADLDLDNGGVTRILSACVGSPEQQLPGNSANASPRLLALATEPGGLQAEGSRGC